MKKKVMSLILAAMLALGALPAYANDDENLVYQVNRNADGHFETVVDKTTPELSFTEPLPNNEIRVVVNNKELTARGVSIDGRTLIPLRALGEALGATVNWDADKQAIRIEKMLYQSDSSGNVTESNRVILMSIGSNESLENGVANALDVAPQIIGASTMVPVRAVTDFLEATVSWDETSRTVRIDPALTDSPQGAQWEQRDLAIGAANATSNYINQVNEKFEQEREVEKTEAKANGELWAWGYSLADIYVNDFGISQDEGLNINLSGVGDDDVLFRLQVIDKSSGSAVYEDKFKYQDLTESDSYRVLKLPKQYWDEERYNYEIKVAVE